MAEITLKTRPPQTRAPGVAIRTREIAQADLQNLSMFFAQGFERSSPKDWLQIFDQLSKHPTPSGFARYGYLLESDKETVGAILVISTLSKTRLGPIVRSNLSSWYVLPEYRSLATLFVSRAIRNKDVTYINVSPATHTVPIITAQGFVRYGQGQHVAVANPLKRLSGAHITEITTADHARADLDEFETDLLARHSRYGCISLVCKTPEGAYPFVFRRRQIRKMLSAARLIYCRDIRDVVRCFGPLSRFLMRNGMPLIAVDADGPIAGLHGMHLQGTTRYYKGPIEPRIGDLADTEAGIFGV